MSTGRNRFALAVLLATALLGCSSTPRFNRAFGTSVRANLSAQTLDPAAATNARPPMGIDGQTARAIHERYQRSFKEPAPSNNQGMIGANGQ
jgi:type IV pilus biogenesis protein CpaD/CtpE